MRRTIAVAACAAILSIACGGDNDDESSSPTPAANSPTAVATVTASETPTVTATSAATATPTSTVAPTATATTAPPAPTTVPAGPKTVVVQLAPSSFSPGSISIAVGDTVRWNWNDGIPHSVTSRGGFESDPAGVKTEGTYSFTFTATGTFDYYCQVHESDGMTGQVVVQ